MIRRFAPIALVLTLLASPALAGGVVMYGAHERPNPRDVASILSRSPQVPEGLKVRAIRLLPDPAAEKLPEPPRTEAGPLDVATAPSAEPVPVPAIVTAVVAPAKPSAKADDTPTSLGLPVQFAFDSARILPSAYDQIDAVAAGIKLTPPGLRIVIEGHTDAIGADAYNLRLSSQRAEAVRVYLITRHGIEPSRLRVVGMGEHAPLNRIVPTAPENRRVEFRAES